MESDHSKGALFRFITTAQRQGLFNPNTAGGYRAAAGKLLEDVADTDDVREIDVGTAVAKYHNRHPGDLSPGSLNTYKKRLDRLLGEFRKYNDNPANYKPHGRGPKVTAAKGRAKGSAIALGAGDLVASDAAVNGTGNVFDSTSPSPSPSLAMSYPLRENFVAQVVLPRNLTTDEARRLCAFIRTLAVDFAPPDG